MRAARDEVITTFYPAASSSVMCKFKEASFLRYFRTRKVNLSNIKENIVVYKSDDVVSH